MSKGSNRANLVRLFFSRNMLVITALGFSSGLPLALTGSTLQAWLKSEGVQIEVIGLFALVGLPYTLKFLWAPFLDFYLPPLLGRRRGWMFLAQLCLLLSIAAMSQSSPGSQPAVVALIALGIAFFSATQDIVADAYRTEILDPLEFGVGASLFVMGYRIAMMVSGGIALILADRLSWSQVYLFMSAAMSVGLLTTWIADEPGSNGRSAAVPRPASLRDAVILPFVEFLKRKGAIEILVFMVIYKLDAALTLALSTPFLLDIGFSKTDIGTVNKVFGLIASIGGGVLGGALMVFLGMRRSLFLFGVLQAAAGLSFMALAKVGSIYSMMVAAVAIENLCSGMGNAAFGAFMMLLCKREFTATQFALLSSFMALTRSLAGAPSGFLAQGLGWPGYFMLCTLIGIPGLLLLTRYSHWNVAKDK